MNDLGCKTNIEVIQRFVSLSGRFVIDAGCGGFALSRQLAGQGARVLAIDPDPIQAELNRRSERIDNVEFVETGADCLPVDDHSIDGVFFGYSLHHIPESNYSQVFSEVQRVLKPDGFLYVIEPTDCPLNKVMQLFHDEEVVRSAAQKALREFAVPIFKSYETAVYHSFRHFESFEDFVKQFASKSFNTNYTEADVDNMIVRKAFDRFGSPDFRFAAPKQVMYLQDPQPGN